MSNEIDRLAELILYHKKLYYEGQPEISDSDYDALEEKLRVIDSENPVLKLVGTPVGGKVKHDPPMLSSDKANSLEEVVKWSRKISNDLYAGYKIDGLSLSLYYESGYFVQAATRGNGIAGDDETYAVMKIRNIPKSIPFITPINIRGELYMRKSEFLKVNKGLPEDSQYSSPRNLAAGTLKQKDLEAISKRELHFMAFDVIGLDGEPTVGEISKLLETWGFESADQFFLKNTPDAITGLYTQIAETRDSLDFEIDGVIFKYNDFADRENAGQTEHHPKWQIAWKFKSKGSITRIKSVTWQLGRTGVLTPVAEVEPVEVAGATISRATLHNAEFLENLDLGVGDLVSIERAGDVIPKIVDVIDRTGAKFQLPNVCPSCQTPVNRNGVVLICNSEECPDRDMQKIIHWIRMADIDGLGPKSIEKLYRAGLVTHYADLYSDKLTKDVLIQQLGKNGGKAHDSIESTRELPFEKFLAGLGITMLGKKLGKDLAKNFISFESLKDTTQDELVKIEGISELTASYIVTGINNPNLGDKVLRNDVQIIYSSKKRKLPIKSQKQGQQGLGAFFGDSEEEVNDKEIVSDGQVEDLGRIYVTGKIHGMTKKEIEAFVEERGFSFSPSISGQMKFLIVGESPGSTKVDKARKLNVEIKSWDEFVNEYP